MAKAYCIKCGSSKKSPHKKCEACGFKPIETLDIVKSVWLSSNRRLSVEDLELDQSPSIEELEGFAKSIKQGENAVFPKTEIDILAKQYAAVSEVTWLKVLLVSLPFVILPLSAIAVFLYRSI